MTSKAELNGRRLLLVRNADTARHGACVLSQTLKKLKGKQEESKKREISRLLSKLEDHASKPLVGRLSELFAHRPSAPEVSTSPEALGR